MDKSGSRKSNRDEPLRSSSLRQRLREGSDNFEFTALIDGVSNLNPPIADFEKPSEPAHAKADVNRLRHGEMPIAEREKRSAHEPRDERLAAEGVDSQQELDVIHDIAPFRRISDQSAGTPGRRSRHQQSPVARLWIVAVIAVTLAVVLWLAAGPLLHNNDRSGAQSPMDHAIQRGAP
jgi:hypothetical protein